MKDFLGKELNIGDEVIYTGSLGKCLCHGSIKRFAGTMADIYSPSPYQETERRECHKIFKVESKQAILDEVCKWIKEHLYDEEYLFRDDEGTWVDSDLLLEDLKNILRKKYER